MSARTLTQSLAVMRKELRDGLRDRRAIFSLVFGAAVGPLLVGGILTFMAGRVRDAQDVTIPVVGSTHAPALVQWLRQQPGVTVTPGPADPEDAIRRQAEDVVVVIPDEFEAAFAAYRPAEINVLADSSRTAARPKQQRVRALLSRYGSEVAALRLVARGVSPSVVTPVRPIEVDIASSQQRAAMIIDFIPLYIMLAAFTGGMLIATDATAGERERGSLEALLVTPASRSALAAGKWMAAGVFSCMSVALTTVLCMLVVNRIPLQDFGVRLFIDQWKVAGLVGVVLPICALAPAMQLYLSTFAKSFKEAQSYLGFLVLVPMLPGLIGSLAPIRGLWWMYAVPFLGQHLLLADIMGGKPMLVGHVLLSVAATAAVAGGLFQGFARLLTRERIIFGR
jgi:sodium transport system permease protein